MSKLLIGLSDFSKDTHQVRGQCNKNAEIYNSKTLILLILLSNALGTFLQAISPLRTMCNRSQVILNKSESVIWQLFEQNLGKKSKCPTIRVQ